MKTTKIATQPIKVVGISIVVNSPNIRIEVVRHWVRTAGRNRHGRRTGTISRLRDGSRAITRCSDAKGLDRKHVLHCETNLQIQHPVSSIHPSTKLEEKPKTLNL